MRLGRCYLSNVQINTKSIISTVDTESFLVHYVQTGNGYLRKISNTLFAALLAHIWKLRGKRVVLTNGVFDVIHVGHIKFLEAAKAKGDYLVVGVNSDRAVSILKGPNRPINHEGDRMTVIAALESVDLVVLINDVRVDSFIETVRPSIWCKGSQYTLETLDQGEVAAARLVKAEIALLEMVEGKSTTNVINAIRGEHEAGSPRLSGRRKQPCKAGC
jgi:rfaE bifunctional protein nucleotidyltransferase chain/domain